MDGFVKRRGSEVAGVTSTPLRTIVIWERRRSGVVYRSIGEEKGEKLLKGEISIHQRLRPGEGS